MNNELMLKAFDALANAINTCAVTLPVGEHLIDLGQHLQEYRNTVAPLRYSMDFNCDTPPQLKQTIVSGSLPLAELGDFVDWIREMNFKKYAEGWCEAGGSNGWYCTTDELLKMFRERWGNSR